MNNVQIQLKSRIVKTELIEWRKLIFLQDDSFKNWSDDAKEKLKKSVVSNQFVTPFYVWQHRDKIYCLDGKHRSIILEELIADGQAVPEKLPATFIRCTNKTEAAKLVLIFSSIYARIDADGLYTYLNNYGLDFSKIISEIDVPGIDLEVFNERFAMDPSIEETIGVFKEKPATVKITFADEEQATAAIEDVKRLIAKYNGSFYSMSAGEI